jgi:hypothetical protein
VDSIRILERWDRVAWTGLVWLRIGTSGELFYNNNNNNNNNCTALVKERTIPPVVGEVSANFCG